MKNHEKLIQNNTLILKIQKRFGSEKHNSVTEKTNKIASNSNDDKIKIESMESGETYAYGTRKDLLCKKEELKCSNIIKQYVKWITLMMSQKKT